MKSISKNSWLYKFNVNFGDRERLNNCKTMRQYVALTAFNIVFNMAAFSFIAYIVTSGFIQIVGDPLKTLQAFGIIIGFVAILGIIMAFVSYVKKLMANGTDITFGD